MGFRNWGVSQINDQLGFGHWIIEIWPTPQSLTSEPGLNSEVDFYDKPIQCCYWGPPH